MAAAAGAALGRRPLRVAVPRSVMAGIACWNEVRQSLGAGAQILTRGKVNEIFHPDWSASDRRLAAAIGFQPRYDLTSGFRDTILWYRAKHWL
jgi:nucleoside-diphosphate-sugar epimerase